MRLLQLQRPLTWLWTALGIVRGTNPSNLAGDIVPTIDAMQGGLGMAVHEYELLSGSLVGGVQTTIGGDPNYSYLVRLNCINPGTANVLLTVQLLDPTQSLGPMLTIGNVPAASHWGWATPTTIAATGIGGGMQFFWVPPGWRLLIGIGTYTTTAGNSQIHKVRLPAGTRPW